MDVAEDLKDTLAEAKEQDDAITVRTRISSLFKYLLC